MKPFDQDPNCFPICCCKFITEQKLGSSVNLWYIERNIQHDITLENLCTRTAQSSRGVRSRRVQKIYYFGLL